MATRTQADPTLVTASDPGELSPIESAIMDACNAMHEARARADAAHAEALEDVLADLLRRYDETDGEDHPNPAWARPNQRALALSAMGRLDEAVRTEQIALRYADTDRRREISLGNIADRLLRLGRYEEAAAYFVQAWECAPTSVPVMATGVQALHAIGRWDQANAIVEALAEIDGLLHAGSELTAYLDYETRLRVIAADLPALKALVARWDTIRAGGVR